MSALTGEEIAYRTLMRERVEEPCLIASWCMKRAFFQHFTGERDIYRHAPETTVQAFLRAGANLCAQFIMPSPVMEHRAADPFAIDGGRSPSAPEPQFASPEAVRDAIAELPHPDTLAREYDVEAAAEAYAAKLLRLRAMARGQMLFIEGFGQADFMGGYTRWGYVNYLTALALYPDHLRRYYDYSGELARLQNLAIVRAIQKHGLAPVVYGGQDICFNDGPIVSLGVLDACYLPALARAVQPLHAAGVRIVWHCDGDVRPLAGRLLDWIGVQGFQGFQEETGCTLAHMANLRTRDGHKPVLWGSLSVTTTLPFGSVEDVRRDVERCFQTAGQTGFALASTSSILPETPLENILALYEHGRRYGREYLAY